MFSIHKLLSLITSISTASAQCHNYVFLTARGTSEVQGPSIAFPTMINATFDTFPGGTEYNVVYPADDYNTSYEGSDDIRRYIDEGIQTCPDQKYVMLGYSQGALVVALALRNYTDVNSPQYQAIEAALVVGNPYHVGGNFVNIDQNGTNLTRNYDGYRYNSSTVNLTIPPLWYTNNRLVDICHTQDGICAPAYPDSDTTIHHLLYVQNDTQKLGIDFLAARLSPNSTVSNTTTTTNSTNPINGTTPSGTTTGTSGTSSSSPSSTHTGAANTIKSPYLAITALSVLFVALMG